MASNVPRMVTFGHGPQVEIKAEDFGSKAAYLARIAKLGIPVPPGFSLNVSICEEYYRNGGKLPRDVPDILRQGIAFIERATGLTFGGRKPLLVSVRSGAPVTMPGVMDTLLNVGLNRETLRRMMSLTGNPRFSWDCYRRLMENFGEVVFSHDAGQYRSLLKDAMKRNGVLDEVELESSSLKRLAEGYERIFLAGGRKLPEDVYEQLELAVVAVLRSWMNPQGAGIPQDEPGTQCPRDCCNGAGHGLWEHRSTFWRRRCLHEEPLDRGERTSARLQVRRPGRMWYPVQDQPLHRKSYWKLCPR